MPSSTILRMLPEADDYGKQQDQDHKGRDHDRNHQGDVFIKGETSLPLPESWRRSGSYEWRIRKSGKQFWEKIWELSCTTSGGKKSTECLWYHCVRLL
ncbi:hypothetical protein TNIN_41911 [Trichonephila inaurata madagascariensis]|uniref:Uncharacterized protein n=1 Tax=Trichonephila inaurata madagascariensis TaxID=2747483 RepID=A0A8X6J5Q1_9ARAC|nr:hypothetical protein TNIN_41911 [Trichonephila inaurata madagascariensis]